MILKKTCDITLRVYCTFVVENEPHTTTCAPPGKRKRAKVMKTANTKWRRNTLESGGKDCLITAEKLLGCHSIHPTMT